MTLEVDVQGECMAAVGAAHDLLMLKNSNGQAIYYTDEGRKFVVPYGMGAGTPDLVCLLAVWGVAVWLCFEVKVPGEKPRKNQEKSHAIWRSFGAMIATVTSPEETVEALEQARVEVRRRILEAISKEKTACLSMKSSAAPVPLPKPSRATSRAKAK